MAGNIIYICHTCYREFTEEGMIKNAGGNVSDICRTCYSILGKGPGYTATISDEEAEKWLEGTKARRNKLERDGKLK